MQTFLCAILLVASVVAGEEVTKAKRGVVGVGVPADWLVHPPPFPSLPIPNSFDVSPAPWLPPFPSAAVPVISGPWAPRSLTPVSPAHATTALDLVALRKRIELAVAQQRYAAAAAAAASAREIAAVSAAKEAVREAAEQRSHAAKAAAAAAATLSHQSQHQSRPQFGSSSSKQGYGSW